MCCSTMAAKFDFSFSENYGYVIDDFEKVNRLIKEHELRTTSTFAIFKSTKDFGNSGESVK